MSSLARILTILVFVSIGLLAGGSLLWYLAYGVETGPPQRRVIATLASPVEVVWEPNGIVAIEAQTLSDAMVALGYVHGRQRAWAIVLCRQAALGQLGEWFGKPALSIDELTRRLGLSSHAQASYEHLDAKDQALLRAYSTGLNSGLTSTDVQLQQEFILLNTPLTSWEPWHTLALERLFAWLATTPPSQQQQSAAGPEVVAFYEADLALRRWLHLHGFDNSVAWAVRDSVGTYFFQRHVYGDTALPFFQEVSLTLASDPPIRGTSLPGTPFIPSGQTEAHAWALLMTSEVHLERTAWHPDSASSVHHRILSLDGTERLISHKRMKDRLPFAPSNAMLSPDSVWTIQWNGLTPTSDWPAWRALFDGQPRPFKLLRGSGLWMDRQANWLTLGTPRIEEHFEAGVFVGASPWSRYAAEFLRTQVSGPVQLESWIDDTYSIWAAQTAPPLVSTVNDQPLETPALRDAITYLRNWDYSFDRASIAASIFDQWMTNHLSMTGTLPGTSQEDSITTTQPLLLQSLTQAVEALTENFGNDQRQWRWERLHPDRRSFPIWSVENLRDLRPDVGAQARFAPIAWSGQGHPSALAWGPSFTQQTLAAPASWEAWHHTDSWNTQFIRRRYLEPYVLLGRYLTSDGPPPKLTLPQAAPSISRTLLLPPVQ